MGFRNKKKHEDYVKFEDDSVMNYEEFSKLYTKIKWKNGSLEKFIKKVDVYVWNGLFKHYNRDCNYYIPTAKLSEFKTIDKKYVSLTEFLDGVAVTEKDELYVDGDINEVIKEHKAFVIKGSDWPYFFNVNGRYVKSNTSNWFKYLCDNYGFVSAELIEEYNGPDKESEHKK